ncbi:type II toxin-antitoxin system TacA family antitoxin [Rhizobium sp.]
MFAQNRLDLYGGQPYATRMTISTAKTARLEARITPDLQTLLRRAAEIEGRSVTDFVVSAVQEAAEKRIEQAQVMRLSLEDQKAFVDAIVNPPEPNAALKRAFARHREIIQSSE